MAVVPITVQVPIWNLRFIYNHVPYIAVDAEADIPTGATVYQPFTVLEGGDEVEITENGGVLPVDDSLIMVTSNVGGAVLPGAGEGEWTADRVSSPNKIIFNTAAIGDFSGVIALSV